MRSILNDRLLIINFQLSTLNCQLSTVNCYRHYQRHREICQHPIDDDILMRNLIGNCSENWSPEI
ncbi:MAG: hypothetical protein ACRC62_02575 [Microcoleus sp.]